LSIQLTKWVFHIWNWVFSLNPGIDIFKTPLPSGAFCILK